MLSVGRGGRFLGQPTKHVRTHTHKLKPLNHFTVVHQPLSSLRFNIFPPARPGLATTATVEAEFAAGLAAAAAFAQASGVLTALPRAAVEDAIRRAPRGSVPGTSGFRMKYLPALGDEGQAALTGVVHLLAGEATVWLMPAVAAHALAGADLLLLCKPGGEGVDGLPRLRPIGMPEVQRKLAASALAGMLKRSGDRGWGTTVKWLSGLSLCVCVPTCFVGYPKDRPPLPTESTCQIVPTGPSAPPSRAHTEAHALAPNRITPQIKSH